LTGFLTLRGSFALILGFGRMETRCSIFFLKFSMILLLLRFAHALNGSFLELSIQSISILWLHSSDWFLIEFILWYLFFWRFQWFYLALLDIDINALIFFNGVKINWKPIATATYILDVFRHNGFLLKFAWLYFLEIIPPAVCVWQWCI
jgi:hypothetical protein